MTNSILTTRGADCTEKLPRRSWDFSPSALALEYSWRLKSPLS